MRVVVAAVVVALALAATLAVARRPKWDELDGYTFAHFVSDFAKPYKFGSKAWKVHEDAFNARLESVRAHNARTDVTYRQGVNHLSDMTREERKRMMPTTPILVENPTARAHVPSAPHRGSHLQMVNGKQTVDWRKAVPAVLTAVKDQGQCGSCWAHGTVETLEAYSALSNGELQVLSQEQLAECVAPMMFETQQMGGCGGMFPSHAYDYAMAIGGLVSEWQYPYTAYYGTTAACNENLQNSTPSLNFTGHVLIPRNDQSAVEKHLMTGPVSITIYVPMSWESYESGIYSDPSCGAGAVMEPSHVVQLVGYGSDAALGGDYWIVRNSWAPTWGADGYIYMQKTANATCGTMTWMNATDSSQGVQLTACGECGLLIDPLYPTLS